MAQAVVVVVVPMIWQPGSSMWLSSVENKLILKNLTLPIVVDDDDVSRAVMVMVGGKKMVTANKKAMLSQKLAYGKYHVTLLRIICRRSLATTATTAQRHTTTKQPPTALRHPTPSSYRQIPSSSTFLMTMTGWGAAITTRTPGLQGTPPPQQQQHLHPLP